MADKSREKGFFWQNNAKRVLFSIFVCKMRADINNNGYLCKNYKIAEQKEVKASHRKLAGIMRQPEANYETARS